MLPAPHRLRSTAAFGHTMRRGVKKGSKTVVAYVHEDKEAIVCFGGPRVGLVVSKAIGNSVARHATSRQLRHAAATVIRELEIPQHISIVLRALPASSTASHEELVKDVRSCIRRALAQG